MIIKYHGSLTEAASIPLVIFLVSFALQWRWNILYSPTNSSPQIVKKSCDEGSRLALYQVPQILLQAITAYSHDPHLSQYNGFVVTLDRTVVHFSRAIMSPTYVQALCEGKPLLEEM